jgi:methyl-accepting chemotaxis protein
MSSFLKPKKLQTKIIVPIAIVSFLVAVFANTYFKSLYEDAKVEELVVKAKSLVVMAEGAREYVGEQYRKNLFKTGLIDIDDILRTVPVFSAMEIGRQKAKEVGAEFKTPKFRPRNPDNEPDDYEAAILKKFESGELKEHWSIDEKRQMLRFMRPVVLTAECMNCHGDPSQSKALWGNDRGEDPTGTRMEGWKVGEVHGAFEVVMPMAPVYANVSDKATVITLIAMAGGILTILVGVYVARNVSKRINKLAVAADQMAEGDLTVEFMEESEDEVGFLSRSFRTMATNLREIVERLRDSSNSLAVSSSQLSDNSNQISSGAQEQSAATDTTSSSMEQMAASIQQIASNADSLTTNVNETSASIQQMLTSIQLVAKNTDELASSVTETSSTIEEMAASIEQVAANAREAGKSSESAVREAQDGGTAVTRTIEGMSKVNEAMGGMVHVIEKLNDSSKKINSIVDVIDDIAEQTNLLALNAAIEAARAGEHGRGFAVVADEVRKLAERSASSAKEIVTLIQEVQKDTENAIKVTQEGSVRTKEGMDLANQAGDILKKIVQTSGVVSRMMSEISKATDQQAKASEQVVKAVENMSTMTSQINMATKEQSAGSTQILKAVEMMNTMTKQVSTATNEQKKGGEQVVKAVENIAKISRSNQETSSQLGQLTGTLKVQSAEIEKIVSQFRTDHNGNGNSKSGKKNNLIVEEYI